MATKLSEFLTIGAAYKKLCTVCKQPLLDHPKCEGCSVLVGEHHLDEGLTGVLALVEPRHHIEGEAPVVVELKVCRSCRRTVKAGRVLKLSRDFRRTEI